MRPIALAVLAGSIYAQPAAVEADLALRLRTAFERIPHAATRAQAEQSREPLRAKLKHAIGIHRVSQPVRATLFPPPSSSHPPPLLILLVPECPSQASVYAQRGFLTACFNQTQEQDLLSGITPQGRIHHDIARVLRLSNIDRTRLVLVGQGPTATLAAALFPQFTHIVIDSPGIGGELIHGIANFADTLDLLALAAPRPMLVNNATTPLTDLLRDHYRLFEAGGKLFLDSSPLEWLVPNSQPATTPPPREIELPAEPATPGPKNSLQQIIGAPLPASRMTMGLNTSLSQEVPFGTQPGIHIPATVYRAGPTGGDYANGHLIAIGDRGRAELANDEVVKEAHRKGWAVFAVDPRGIGEMKLADEKAAQIASFHLGEYFPWRQATDIARIIDFIARPSSNLHSALYAKGPKSTLIAALLAATTDAEWILLRDPAPSLEVDPPFYTNFDLKTLLRNSKFVNEPRFE